ncbi:Hpt domain-containing protein [Herbaspirillum sp. RTI4]|uniref:Hpt domain-containing protein n=1 Tax=Herbaspirillum sp. RTI4 TaxID=3048640 RepID=UPI002AB5C5A6|nr:Hpt domain-containing protein [Herbaspirillum sp. RTI4]MDY7578228.1 Hpt domain-containing protein [Herbaspirillum sp. RTI4]MEA9981566.1 Hpt domain-containing protein [Herbaspirillum sp. RTI4]
MRISGEFDENDSQGGAEPRDTGSAVDGNETRVGSDGIGIPENALPEQAHSSRALAVLNLNRLQDLFSDDERVQRKMLDLFLSGTPETFDQLATAIGNRDFEHAAALGHRLAGSCVNLGVEELSGLAREVESAAHKKDLSRLIQLREAMLSAFARLYEYINKMRKPI